MCLHYHGSMGGSSVIIGGTVYNQEVWGFVMSHGKGVECSVFKHFSRRFRSPLRRSGDPQFKVGGRGPLFPAKSHWVAQGVVRRVYGQWKKWKTGPFLLYLLMQL